MQMNMRNLRLMSGMIQYMTDVVEMTNLYPNYRRPRLDHQSQRLDEFWYESEDILGLDE